MPAFYARTLAPTLLLLGTAGFLAGCGGTPVDANGREVAEWVVKKGGRVVLHGSDRELSQLDQLPEGAFAITGIDLAGRKVSDKEIEPLADLKALRNLTLYQTGVTDKGLETVAKIRTLRTLELSYTPVTDTGLEQLTALPRLERLHVTGTAVTAEGRKMLEKARSGLTIVP